MVSACAAESISNTSRNLRQPLLPAGEAASQSHPSPPGSSHSPSLPGRLPHPMASIPLDEFSRSHPFSERLDLVGYQQLPLNVLIVDDSAEWRSQLVAQLNQQPGLRVIGEAGTAAAALDHFFQYRPAVVVLPICLPDGSGFQVLDCIKRAEPRSSVILTCRLLNPFVVYSARLLGATEVCTIANGVKDISDALSRLVGERSEGESGEAGRDGIST